MVKHTPKKSDGLQLTQTPPSSTWINFKLWKSAGTHPNDSCLLLTSYYCRARHAPGGVHVHCRGGTTPVQGEKVQIVRSFSPEWWGIKSSLWKLCLYLFLDLILSTWTDFTRRCSAPLLGTRCQLEKLVPPGVMFRFGSFFFFFPLECRGKCYAAGHLISWILFNWLIFFILT